MRKNWYLLILSGFAALLGLAPSLTGCGAICPPQNVSFKNCVVPTLEANCAGGGCHGGDSPEYGLQVEKDHYRNIVGSKKSPKRSTFNYEYRMVEPGKPEKSVLYIKMVQKNPKIGKTKIGIQMPLYRGYMTQAQLDMIKAWITEGAKNN